MFLFFFFIARVVWCTPFRYQVELQFPIKFRSQSMSSTESSRKGSECIAPPQSACLLSVPSSNHHWARRETRTQSLYSNCSNSHRHHRRPDHHQQSMNMEQQPVSTSWKRHNLYLPLLIIAAALSSSNCSCPSALWAISLKTTPCLVHCLLFSF